jgi:hypothetical protein
MILKPSSLVITIGTYLEILETGSRNYIDPRSGSARLRPFGKYLAGDRPQRRIYAMLKSQHERPSGKTPPGRAVKFYLKWRHHDGSAIEFSPAGWNSDDPQKASWLRKMDQLSSSVPSIPPAIRNWLKQECELVAFGEPEYLKQP